MNKVTIINLNGQAFQLEEKAYDMLHSYLESARRELKNDPDKEEIMQDFEQAIADKCSGLLDHHKNVVTAEEIEHIITAMGKVESGSQPDADQDSRKTQPDNKAGATSQPTKRLYLLQEGSMIGGVCNGVAAYLNVDVTIVRLAFVILAFVSSGFWILVYLLLMLVLPTATTPEQKAELRGERFTAQDIINKAKQKYGELGQREHWEAVGQATAPALSRAGQVTRRLLRLGFYCISMLLWVMVTVMSAAWIAATAWLLTGHLHVIDQLQTIPLWAIELTLTAGYLLVLLPVAALAFALDKAAFGKYSKGRNGRVVLIFVSLWALAICTLAALAGAYASRIADYQRTHAYMQINGHQLCVNQRLCDPGDTDGKLFMPPILAPDPVDLPPPPAMQR